MKYIYLLIWLSFRNITKADGKTHNGYHGAQMTGHIVGGVEVPVTMYPHVAALIIEERFLCGGSIVSERVIVTAAHCVVSNYILFLQRQEPKDIRVFVGSAHRYQGTQHEVCKVVPHESYFKNHLLQSYFNDIAVLMLSKRINYGPTIQKVEIAPNESWRREKYSFTVAGFGSVETDGMNAQKLLATRMHYVDSRTCNQSQGVTTMIVPDHMFCMIGKRWTSDCFGDSGSGVIWRRYLVGVVSIGRENFCGADMIPSMYTDVTYFRKWIYSKIKEADSLPDEACQPSAKEEKINKQKKLKLTKKYHNV